MGASSTRQAFRVWPIGRPIINTRRAENPPHLRAILTSMIALAALALAAAPVDSHHCR
jgi:hypothetical protein